MSTYLLVEVAKDGTASVTTLTDPVSVTTTVELPLADLLPAAPTPAPADPNVPAA